MTAKISAKEKETKKKLRKQKKRTMRPATPSKGVEVRYRKDLLKVLNKARKKAEVKIIKLLKRYEADYIADDYSEKIIKGLEKMLREGQLADAAAERIAKKAVNKVDADQKRKLIQNIKAAVGVDASAIINNANMAPQINKALHENAELIKTIPSQHLQKIEKMVMQEAFKGSSSKSMIEQIREIGAVSERRARVIARDQTSKINGALNEARQKQLEIEEYIWRAQIDGRERKSHREKDGKVFRWDSPPSDTGHPSEDINCRCTAIPVIPKSWGLT